MKIFWIASISLAETVAAAAAGFSWSTTSIKILAPGVILTQEVQTSPALLVNTLTVDPSVPGVQVAPAIANDSLTANTGNIRKGRENVSALVARKGLLAAVNGDYFPYTGDPLGVGVTNSELYSEPYLSSTVLGRAAIGFLPSGKVIVGIPKLVATITAQDTFEMPITGIDRLTSTTDLSDVVVVTPRFGPTSGARGGGIEIVVDQVNLPLSPGKQMVGKIAQITTGNAPAASVPSDGVVISMPSSSTHTDDIAAHFHVGDSIGFVCSLTDATPASDGSADLDPQIWNEASNIIGGGPILLHHGQVVVDDVAEGFTPDFSNSPHSRTAVGVRADGKIVIVTVDANSEISAGISLQDLATLMQSKGAVDAINLDGGGSTTMVAEGLTIGDPNGSNSERPVADMLTVAQAVPTLIVDSPQIQVPAAPLQIGDTYPLVVRADGRMISGAQQNLVWGGPVGNIGFVTQDGMLHVLRPGHGTIIASYFGNKITDDIDVAAPLPTTEATPVPAAQ